MMSGVGSQLVSLAAPILLLPAMLSYLGEEEFGIWSSAVAAAGLAAVLDFGLGSTILARVARARAVNNISQVSRYLTSAYVVLSAVAVVGLLVIFSAWCVAVYGYSQPQQGWSIFLIVIGAFFIGLPISVIFKVMYAYQMVPMHSALQAFSALLAVAIALSAISVSSARWLVIFAYSFSPIIVMICVTLWFFSNERSISIGSKSFRLSFTKSLVGSSSRFFYLSVLTAFGTNADIVLISLFAGPAAVAEFVPPARIGSILAVMVANLFMPLWTFNGAALARGDYEWVRRNTTLMSLGGTALVIVAGTVILLISHPLMLFWMGRSFEDQTVVLLGMVALAAVTAFTSPFNMVLNARGEAATQIAPWAKYVLSSLLVKSLTIYYGYAAFVPAQSAVLYLTFVAPVMVSRGSAILNRRISSGSP